MRRRGALLGAAAAALPRFAIGETDRRPSITVAVQKISNTGTLDPLREQSSNASERWMGSILETLIGRDQQAGLRRVPALATGWRRIDDATVELDVRPGVRMHDGAEMTAEDVAFSFGPERMFGAALPPDIPIVARRHWPGLARVEIVDAHTVRFVNAAPDVTMEGRISAGGSEIVSAAAWRKGGSWQANARRAVGTGPYKVTTFEADRMLVLDSHDEYWGGRPPLRRLSFVEVPEAAARIAGLLAGDYQFATDIPPDQIGEIARNPRMEVVGGPVLNHRIVTFDRHHPALADPRVRLAMAHAVDGQAIVDSLWDGRTRVPPGLQWEFYGDMFVPGWSVPKPDPRRAQNLLREAGYVGDPISYRIRADYYTAEAATAQILAELWRQVGLNIEVEIKENWAQVLEPADRGVRDWSNSATFDDPVSSIVAQHGPDGAQQRDGEWSNEEMNELCRAMLTGTDRAARRAMFARMLEICEREDPAYIVLHQNAVFTAKRRDLPWRASPSFFLDFSPANWRA